jgi:hypothetical protein
MSNPNLTVVEDIQSYTIARNLDEGYTLVLSNPSNSNQLFRVGDLKASNLTSESQKVSIWLNNNGNFIYLIKDVEIPAQATLPILTKEIEINIEENSSIVAYIEDSNSIDVSSTYTVISETDSTHNKDNFSIQTVIDGAIGDTTTFNIFTQNLPNGSTVDYIITGVTSADIGGAGLAGSLTITNNQTSFSFIFQESSEEKTLQFLLPEYGIFAIVTPLGQLYSFTTATFTNGGQVGRLGPSLTQARDGVSGPEANEWKNNTEFFNTANGIQLWTVPADGTYRIEAWGAQGEKAGTLSTLGGNGARMRGDFVLTAGEVLRIVVGQMGGISTGQSGGGGGGSYVLKQTGTSTSDILVIAGGGGGAQRSNTGGVGSSTTSATAGGTFAVPTIGSGGNNSGANGGAGGAGWNGNGQDGQGGADSGGKSPANGFLGGIAGTCASSGFGINDVGGFGGGGGGEWCSQGAAGGGGGFTGGNGSNGAPAGGGAGSFNSGDNQSNSAGVRTGNGQVTITLL